MALCVPGSADIARQTAAGNDRSSPSSPSHDADAQSAQSSEPLATQQHPIHRGPASAQSEGRQAQHNLPTPATGAEQTAELAPSATGPAQHAQHGQSGRPMTDQEHAPDQVSRGVDSSPHEGRSAQHNLLSSAAEAERAAEAAPSGHRNSDSAFTQPDQCTAQRSLAGHGTDAESTEVSTPPGMSRQGEPV